MRAALTVMSLGISITVFSQDGHFWTQQYGTRSMLLSNSVIGGVDDLGAVYYNPGRLAVVSNTAFLLSANVYEYNRIAISDAFGNSKNASKSDIKGVPTLAAGTFGIKQWPKHRFAYAILTRQSSSIDFSYRNEIKGDVVPSLPGNETFGANLDNSQDLREQWIGVTWSYPLSEKVSVGVTTNFTTSSQSKTGTINMQVLSQSNDVATYRFNRNFTYKQNGLLWKAGLATKLGLWQTGLTITSPVLSLSGSGTYTYEEFYSAAPGLPLPEKYTSSYQKGLSVKHKSPVSVGVGASRPVGKNKLHFSAEWYGSVAQYTMMNAENHASQSNPTDTVKFQLVDQSKSIVNVGVGAEIFISERVSGFASFSTDMTTVPSDITRFIERQSQVNNNTWNSDFYHFGGGVVLKLKGADITLGATHTGGNQTLPRPASFPDGSGGGIFTGGGTADMQWDRWRFVFSFSFPFLKDYAEKLEKKITGDKD